MPSFLGTTCAKFPRHTLQIRRRSGFTKANHYNGTGSAGYSALSGAKGFEPLNVGTKIRCLTTWRHPNPDLKFITRGSRFEVRGSAWVPHPWPPATRANQPLHPAPLSRRDDCFAQRANPWFPRIGSHGLRNLCGWPLVQSKDCFAPRARIKERKQRGW